MLPLPPAIHPQDFIKEESQRTWSPPRPWLEGCVSSITPARLSLCRHFPGTSRQDGRNRRAVQQRTQALESAVRQVMREVESGSHQAALTNCSRICGASLGCGWGGVFLGAAWRRRGRFVHGKGLVTRLPLRLTCTRLPLSTTRNSGPARACSGRTAAQPSRTARSKAQAGHLFPRGGGSAFASMASAPRPPRAGS